MRAVAIVLVCLQLSGCAGTPPARGCDPPPVPARGDQVNSASGAIIVALFMLLGIMTAKTPPSCDRADVRLP
jgi:hypothetical protein